MREMEPTSGGTVHVKLLTIREVAGVLRVSEATAYRMREDGELPAIKVRGQWRVLEATLVEMLTPEPHQATA